MKGLELLELSDKKPYFTFIKIQSNHSVNARNIFFVKYALLV